MAWPPGASINVSSHDPSSRDFRSHVHAVDVGLFVFDVSLLL